MFDPLPPTPSPPQSGPQIPTYPSAVESPFHVERLTLQGSNMGSMWGIVWGTKGRIFVKVERETGFEPATLSLEG